jgi:hypothetical protein
MPEIHSRQDKRVEIVSVNDNPHERYSGVHPVTGEELNKTVPILTNTQKGNIVEKNVNYNVIQCPDCNIPARYTHNSEPVCPECGTICSGKDGTNFKEVVIDAKAAGRL